MTPTVDSQSILRNDTIEQQELYITIVQMINNTLY